MEILTSNTLKCQYTNEQLQTHYIEPDGRIHQYTGSQKCTMCVLRTCVVIRLTL